jgi:hypothetical protein
VLVGDNRGIAVRGSRFAVWGVVIFGVFVLGYGVWRWLSR